MSAPLTVYGAGEQGDTPVEILCPQLIGPAYRVAVEKRVCSAEFSLARLRLAHA